jgi:F-type H+-transporting ATPase subunit gamma
MAQKLAELGARVATAHQLESVVGALRAIAATRARQSRARLEGVRAYAETIAVAIGQALQLLPQAPDAAPAAKPNADPQRTMLLLFCAEQGFAGSFSERILDAAGAGLYQAQCLVIGSRGAHSLRLRGREPSQQYAMISQVSSVGTLANRLSRDLAGALAEHRVQRVEMIYAEPTHAGHTGTSDGGTRVCQQLLVPFDYSAFGNQHGRPPAQPPLIQLPAAQLLESLAAEYMFASLCAALLHSFAAENTARMLAMASARDNITNKLEALGREERLARQEQITDEILELAAGRAR